MMQRTTLYRVGLGGNYSVGSPSAWRRRQLLSSCSFNVWAMPWIAQPSQIKALQPE